MIKIISVGKKPSLAIKTALDTYEKRLHGPYAVKWVLIQNSPLAGSRGVNNESQAILRGLHVSDFCILLDETGKNISSPELSQLLATQIDNSKAIVFIIGGAYGVNQAVKNRADFTWMLSKLVFPHQLVRLILAEQIYRAQTITQGHPYHHQ